MFIKSVSSPIGFFDAIYSDEGLRKLSFLDQKRSRHCLLYTSPSPRDVEESRMPSSA